MKTHSLVTFTRGVMLGAIVCGCGADPSESAEGVIKSELSDWADSIFIQVLRVDPGPTATTVRNRCEMTLRLQSAKPLTFIASASGIGSSAATVGWTGSAISSSGLTVSACTGSTGSFCNVTATFVGTASNGGAAACQMIADDGASRIVGNSSGNSMTVPGTPSSPVIFHQHVQTTNSGTARTGTCILRQNGFLPTAQVTGFSVFLNGTEKFNVPSASLAGTWPTPGPSVPFGRIAVGSDAVATRLKHMTLRNAQLANGDALRCAGTFSQNSIISTFSVNTGATPAGNGMSITTEPTDWTCNPTAFGTGNGCDCDCGVLDPDCGAHDCTHFSVTTPNGVFAYFIDGVQLPNLDLVKGRTYVFDVNVSAFHPFAIHQAPSQPQGARYTEGVIGVQPVTAGQLKFTPPLAAPAAVYYQCENHFNMTGTLNLLPPP